MGKSKEKATEWLPVVDFDGTRYVVDIEHRQFRPFDNPTSGISFYSETGRQMTEAMAGTEWRVFTARELWDRKDEQVI